MARRAVAVVLVINVDDDLTSVALASLAADRLTAGPGAATPRVTYVEVHDDLDAVLDPDTAARYRIGD